MNDYQVTIACLASILTFTIVLALGAWDKREREKGNYIGKRGERR